MARRSQRNRRRSQANAHAGDQQTGHSNGNAARQNGNANASGARHGGTSNGNAPDTNASANRYQKYLPEWMKGANGATFRPPRPRRARQARPVGGYTPGKFARGDGDRL